MPFQQDTCRNRRSFLRGGTLVLAASAPMSAWLSSGWLAPTRLSGAESAAVLRFALITDLHYADKPPAGTRHYRQTLDKLAEAAKQFEQDQPSFIVELGDLIDAADSVSTELSYLATINRAFSAIGPDRMYVLGNHCVDTLTKQEFLKAVGQAKSYFSFDRSGLHGVVLDACFRSDGEPYQRKNFQWDDAHIPDQQLEWLQADLAATDKPTVVFAHQRLDVAGKHSVKNHAQVRQVLEASGKVLAVFQGHSHANDLQQLGGIPYCTLVAMVEGAGPDSNGYSLVTLQADGTLEVTGFRRQQNYRWPPEATLKPL